MKQPTFNESRLSSTEVETHAEAFQKSREARRSELMEDYVELIADLIEHSGEARQIDIAQRLGVKQPTARNDAERKTLLRFSNWECVIALAVAGMVNMAMVIMAAAAFHAGHTDVAEIETAYHTLTPLLGGAAAMVFLISLMASGMSSSAVGTMAGQMIMQGFVGFHIPIWLRRLVTMLPAFVVVLMGVNTTDALVYSQVVLSFALPIPMIALVMFTRNPAIMGSFANKRLLDIAAIVGTIIILCLNAVLLLQTFGVPVPGLG